VSIIFGAEDPSLNPGVALSLHEALSTSVLSLLPKRGIGLNWMALLRWHSSCSHCQKIRERKGSPIKEMATICLLSILESVRDSISCEW
jgi:hypothetical protein